MKHPNFGLVSLLLFLFSYASTQLSAQQVEQGVLDLRGYVIGEETEIGLDGDWGFVWGDLIDPATAYSPSQFIEVPGNWNDFEQGGQEIGADGYGSYVLEILFDDSINNLGLDLTAISTAFTLYLNGEQIVSGGQVGTSSISSVPKYNPGVVFFNATPRTRLVFHVSNFNHRHGGIRDELALGNPNYLVKKRSLLLMASIFLCGCFFVMGF